METSSLACCLHRSSHASTKLMLNQDRSQDLDGKLLSYHALCHSIIISHYVLSCEIVFVLLPKEYFSLSPGCSTPVLRGFRYIVGKVSMGRSLLYPEVMEGF